MRTPLYFFSEISLLWITSQYVLLVGPHCIKSRFFTFNHLSLGDVNLYLNDPEDDQVGEIEVMIAEESARQKGCATEALKLLMGYCYDTIHISRFVAKIGKHNLKSYSLFKNKVSKK